MIKTIVTSALAGALGLGLATAAIAGEFGDMCSWGLANGKTVKTDCSVNAAIKGKTYCFSNKEAMGEFMKNPDANLAKAQVVYGEKGHSG
jgi:YHS domain-containing protein